MSNDGAAPRAAAPVSNARAEASRRNGAKSRGPKTQEGKARSARNALKHGMRAERYLVLAEEDAGEFAALEAALIEELAPVGVLQTVLARRIAMAAWRLARADRMEAEVLEFRGGQGVNPGLALIRDGNGTRSFETLLRYRGAAMAEFWRALKTLKALQAEQAAANEPALAAHPLNARPKAQSTRPAARPPLVRRPQPDEPERNPEPRPEYVSSEPPPSGRTLHEPAAPPWLPDEPEPRQTRRSAPARADLAPNGPDRTAPRRPDHGRTAPPPAPTPAAMRAPDSHGRMDPPNRCRAYG